MSEDQAIWARVECLSEDAQASSDWLWTQGAQGVEVRDGETFFEEDPEFAPVPDGKARLIAYIEVEDSMEALAARLHADAPSHLKLVTAARFDDRSWATKWREFFTPRHLSPHAIVGPPWEDFDAPRDGHAIIVEPGMAFGTGTHETTQVVSHLLEDFLRDHPTTRMLDVGCGSGILCMHASFLGVQELTGVDVEPEAIENAQHNLTLNALTAHAIDFSTTPLHELPGTWELVVANILSHILVSLSAELVAHTQVGGQLILSGILEHQLADIRAAFPQAHDLRELEVRQLGEWFALRYLRAS